MMRHDSRPILLVPAWTTMTYDFSNQGIADQEIVCEFRGTQGAAIFDTDSLRVLRKPD